MWSIDLSGQTAVVVGGAGAIGSACALGLARAGAQVAIADYRSDRGLEHSARLVLELDALGVRGCAVPVDVTQGDSVTAMAASVRERLGRPSILVYAAGIADRVSLEELAEERWQRMVEVSLTGAYRAVRALLVDLLEQRGAVVLIGSQVSMTGGGGGAHYAAAKAGLEGLTRALSRELLPRGVRVNTVQPCLVDTPMLRERYQGAREVEALVAQVPRGRLGRPEDIANAVVFLASDAADFICGQHLLVDGGRTFSQ